MEDCENKVINLQANRSQDISKFTSRYTKKNPEVIGGPWGGYPSTEPPRGCISPPMGATGPGKLGETMGTIPLGAMGLAASGGWPQGPRPMAPIGGRYTLERLRGGVGIPPTIP